MTKTTLLHEQYYCYGLILQNVSSFVSNVPWKYFCPSASGQIIYTTYFQSRLSWYGCLIVGLEQKIGGSAKLLLNILEIRQRAKIIFLVEHDNIRFEYFRQTSAIVMNRLWQQFPRERPSNKNHCFSTDFSSAVYGHFGKFILRVLADELLVVKICFYLAVAPWSIIAIKIIFIPTAGIWRI